MKRRLFNILSAVSLVLCVAAEVLWVRTYWVADCIEFLWQAPTSRLGYTWVMMESVGGSLDLRYIDTRDFAFPRKLGDTDNHDGQPDGPRLSHYTEPFVHHQVWTFAYSSRQESHAREGYMRIRVPYWVFVLSTAVLPLFWTNSHVKKRRRLKQGLCPTCGYDLRASKDGCPECGTPIPVQTASSVKA